MGEILVIKNTFDFTVSIYCLVYFKLFKVNFRDVHSDILASRSCSVLKKWSNKKKYKITFLGTFSYQTNPARSRKSEYRKTLKCSGFRQNAHKLDVKRTHVLGGSWGLIKLNKTDQRLVSCQANDIFVTNYHTEIKYILLKS